MPHRKKNQGSANKSDSSIVITPGSSAARIFLGKKYAEKLLREALSGIEVQKYIADDDIMVPDSESFVSAVEPILFMIYGQKNILDQRPYEIYLIRNYWVMFGSKAPGAPGDTFIVIMDERNARIVKLSLSKDMF